MNATQAYSTIHRALGETAGAFQLVPMEVRVLVALADRAGKSRTAELEDDLCQRDGSAIRRTLSTLRARGFVVGGDVRGRRADLILGSASLEVLVHFGAGLQMLEDAAGILPVTKPQAIAWEALHGTE